MYARSRRTADNLQQFLALVLTVNCSAFDRLSIFDGRIDPLVSAADRNHDLFSFAFASSSLRLFSFSRLINLPPLLAASLRRS
jgi:hypothetical protein